MPVLSHDWKANATTRVVTYRKKFKKENPTQTPVHRISSYKECTFSRELEKAPAATFLGTFTLAATRLTFTFAALELSQAFHLVEDELQELLPSNDLEMAANAWILFGELLDIGFREVSAESQVEFAGEVVVEF